MHYLNAAGTSWPKPDLVAKAVQWMSTLSPLEWPDAFERWHQTVADFFHVPRQRLLLTPSCTAALQLGVLDHAWMAGDRIVTSGFEHHAMQRNFVKLQTRGVEVVTLPPLEDSRRPRLFDLAELDRTLDRQPAKLVAFTAACNVTGLRAPALEDAAEIAHRHGAMLLVDGAQIAGWEDIDLESLGVDLVTVAGHKGPQAPWGIGGLYVAPHVTMTCPLAVCGAPPPPPPPPTAQNESHGGLMPGYCDAGSVNMTALAGWAAACGWLAERPDRLAVAAGLASQLSDGLRRLPGVELQHDIVDAADWHGAKMPTVSMTLAGASVAEVGLSLARQGISVSAGFHCSPAAHESLGTDAQGTVRMSIGPMSGAEEVAAAVEALSEESRAVS